MIRVSIRVVEGFEHGMLMEFNWLNVMLVIIAVSYTHLTLPTN